MENHDSHHHILPVKTYVLTLLTLLVLTAITVLVARFDFGALNIVVAMGVAMIKASIVLLIFMGMRWEKGISWVLLLSGLSALILFFLLTFSDIAYRDMRDPLEAEQFDLVSPVKLIEAGHHPPGH